MSELHRSDVTLRFFGDDLDPDELTRLLGAKPTVGVRKGGVWKTSRGVEKFASKGSWRLGVERRSPGDIDGQIRNILGQLTNDLAVWSDLSARFSAVLFCGLFMEDGNEGLTLDSEVLQMIGERHLALNLDIYAPD